MKINIAYEEQPFTNLLFNNFLQKDEQELAHDDYILRKHEIISKLFTIYQNLEIPTVYRNWIREAARFINEKEV